MWLIGAGAREPAGLEPILRTRAHHPQRNGEDQKAGGWKRKPQGQGPTRSSHSWEYEQTAQGNHRHGRSGGNGTEPEGNIRAPAQASPPAIPEGPRGTSPSQTAIPSSHPSNAATAWQRKSGRHRSLPQRADLAPMTTTLHARRTVQSQAHRKTATARPARSPGPSWLRKAPALSSKDPSSSLARWEAAGSFGPRFQAPGPGCRLSAVSTRATGHAVKGGPQRLPQQRAVCAVSSRSREERGQEREELQAPRGREASEEKVCMYYIVSATTQQTGGKPVQVARTQKRRQSQS